MEKKIGIVEVGSTNSKSYLYDNGIIFELGFKTIEFKKNYIENGRILSNDIKILNDYINFTFSKGIEVYVYGTSIFRELTTECISDLRYLLQQNRECVSFAIVSSEEENELTVIGAVNNVSIKENVCVFIGGGGSTEISICKDGEIVEMVNSSIGVSDIMREFPDLLDDIATSSIEAVSEYIMEQLVLPKNKADYIILAGGDYILRYENANYPVTQNKLFYSQNHPYEISYEKNLEYEKKYYHEIHLSDLKLTTPDNPNWWNGTRSMCAFTNAISLAIGAKIIIPTRISMIYGLVKRIMAENNEN